MEYTFNGHILTSIFATAIAPALLVWGIYYGLYRKIFKRTFTKAIKGLSGALVWFAASLGTLPNYMAGKQELGVNSFIFAAIVGFIVFFFIHFNLEADKGNEAEKGIVASNKRGFFKKFLALCKTRSAFGIFGILLAGMFASMFRYDIIPDSKYGGFYKVDRLSNAHFYCRGMEYCKKVTRPSLKEIFSGYNSQDSLSTSKTKKRPTLEEIARKVLSETRGEKID